MASPLGSFDQQSNSTSDSSAALIRRSSTHLMKRDQFAPNAKRTNLVEVGEVMP